MTQIKRGRKHARSLFICVYLFQAGLLALLIPPINPDSLFSRCVRTIRPVLITLGLYHYERYYAPEPPKTIRRYGFAILDRSGLLLPWSFPRRRLFATDQGQTFQRYVNHYVTAVLRRPHPARELMLDELMTYVRSASGVDGTVRIFLTQAPIQPPQPSNNPDPVFGPPHPVGLPPSIAEPATTVTANEKNPELLDTEIDSPDDP